MKAKTKAETKAKLKAKMKAETKAETKAKMKLKMKTRKKGEWKMALYSEKVMDHFRNPRNVGIIEDADGIGEAGNPVCGDIMKIYLKINEQKVIEDVKFETFGCGSAIASSSMATELIKGQALDDALKLTNKAVTEALDGLPVHKLHCSVLAEEAIKLAVKDYYDKNGIEYDPGSFPVENNCEACSIH